MTKTPFNFPKFSAGVIGCISLFGLFASSAAADLSYNTGSLGTLGDGTHAGGAVLDQPGALPAFGDYSVSYTGGARTTVPFRPQLNPASGSPFTIEFWAKPVSSDGDDAPVSNRVATGNRSGWVFFQRAPDVGWNLRMYDGNGSAYGWDLTGGTSAFGVWTHVVGVWSGSSATLYVNGVLADDSNGAGLSGIYNANTATSIDAFFSVGALFSGLSPYNGSVDEVAFYPTALSATQIANHFTAAASPAPGAYSSLGLTDGAVEYLQQNPPTVKLVGTGKPPTVTFTGILSQSTDLTTWEDLVATSPYTPTGPLPSKLFFRAHR